MVLNLSIDRYFRLPFMWVMLLWALTLPGQEVAVYKFLINAISGKVEENNLATQHGFHSSEDLQSQTVHVFLDAELSSSRLITQHTTRYIVPALTFFFVNFSDKELLILPKFNNWISRVTLFLPVSILPNAP